MDDPYLDDSKKDGKKTVPPDHVMISVRVIQQEKKNSLVEYEDDTEMLRRVSIPTAKISEGYASEATLAKGIPYGLQWEDMEIKPVTHNQVANILRAHGIWTAADAQSNPADLRAAIQQIHGPLLSVIYQFINRK